MPGKTIERRQNGGAGIEDAGGIGWQRGLVAKHENFILTMFKAVRWRRRDRNHVSKPLIETSNRNQMTTWRHFQRASLAVGLLATWCSVAQAHPHHPEHGTGLADGLLHPLLGLDHLLAMVATGLLAAQLGGKTLWAAPASFVGSMMVGGLCGMAGVALPGVEFAVALSIVVLGLALAVNKKQPLALPIAAVALFGFFHGQAHGVEAPSLVAPAIYMLGFVAATTAFHVTGVLLGRWAVASAKGQMALRFSGAAIAGAGLMFLMR